MFRSLMVVGVLGLGGLFGYYFLRDNPSRDASDRARDAARQVGGTVVSQGVEGLVQARLVARFGYESVSFLHAHFADGRLVIYGLAPETVTVEALQAEGQAVPGVKEVEVLVSPRPAHVKTIFSRESAPQPAPETPTP